MNYKNYQTQICEPQTRRPMRRSKGVRHKMVEILLMLLLLVLIRFGYDICIPTYIYVWVFQPDVCLYITCLSSLVQRDKNVKIKYSRQIPFFPRAKAVGRIFKFVFVVFPFVGRGSQMLAIHGKRNYCIIKGITDEDFFRVSFLNCPCFSLFQCILKK